ncbi:MAG TPA: hypothetical protein VGG35_22045 [Streptosporangiaceae bacterium]|jgi:hypothetical protein
MKAGIRVRATVAGATAALMATGVLALGAASAAPAATAATTPRIDLGVLVVTDGNAWTEAIRQQLSSEGVPTTVINLNDPGRPTITSSYLSGTLANGTPEGHFQGVVLPNDIGGGLSPSEMTALANYESAFSVRQVDAYLYPTGNVGTNAPSYAGPLDGSAATVTTAAKAAGFGYLKGTYNFQGTAGGATSYGYLATPLPNTPTTTFTPFLTETIPGTTTTGTLAGVYNNNGREQMEISFGYNYYQLQYRYLAHGIVDWLTRGVHFGYWRNYLTADSDDEFNADAEWSQVGKCTPNDTACPPGTPDTTPSRMTPADVTYAVNWEAQHNFTLELLFNGGASSRFQVNGVDPQLAAFKPVASKFWWVSHTYTHQWLGCIQDFTVSPWQCVTDGSGNTEWVDYNTINGEITNNIQWAQANGIPIEPDELAPGEYSGLRILPQQPVDNPNLVQAINDNGVKWVPIDASRDPAMRPIGNALGVPRHPIDVFYNVSTKADETSEYNWIYDSAANGGSGLCTANGTPCLAPLSLTTGWTSFILPVQINTMLGSMVQNDPRPFMFHQSNLSGERLLYPVVLGALTAYRAVYATSAPVVNQRLSGAGAALNSQGQWAQALGNGTVSGYVQGTTVTITGPSGTSVPLTMPAGTKVGTSKGAAFGASYAQELSAYTTLGSAPLTLVLKATAYAGGAATAAKIATTTRAVKSTATINAAKNPAALPKGKQGTAILNAVNGPATTTSGKKAVARP